MLIERSTEISTLERSLAPVSEGTGAAVVIEAAAGAGKSALLDLAEHAARDAGLLVRRAAHGPAERRFPLGTMRALIEPLLGVEAARDPFRACASLGPVALLVDDAQWVDRASLDALAHLARRARDLPLLLVVAARPSDAPAELAGIPGVARLEPARLSAAGAAELVRRVAPGASGELCARCHAAAGGDLWLLGELARQSPTLTPQGRIEVRRRLGQLTAPERRVAHALAILERQATRIARPSSPRSPSGTWAGSASGWPGTASPTACTTSCRSPSATACIAPPRPRCDAPASRPRRSHAISFAAAPRPIPRPPPRCARPPPEPLRARRSGTSSGRCSRATTARRCSPSSPPPPSTPGGRIRAAGCCRRSPRGRMRARAWRSSRGWPRSRSPTRATRRCSTARTIRTSPSPASTRC